MNVLVAMSGGVDSSAAAAICKAQGHDVAGVTLKLWGGPSDQGCCSVADVDDARRVAGQLGIDHHIFNKFSNHEHSHTRYYRIPYWFWDFQWNQYRGRYASYQHGTCIW